MMFLMGLVCGLLLGGVSAFCVYACLAYFSDRIYDDEYTDKGGK